MRSPTLRTLALVNSTVTLDGLVLLLGTCTQLDTLLLISFNWFDKGSSPRTIRDLLSPEWQRAPLRRLELDVRFTYPPLADVELPVFVAILASLRHTLVDLRISDALARSLFLTALALEHVAGGIQNLWVGGKSASPAFTNAQDWSTGLVRRVYIVSSGSTAMTIDSRFAVPAPSPLHAQPKYPLNFGVQRGVLARLAADESTVRFLVDRTVSQVPPIAWDDFIRRIPVHIFGSYLCELRKTKLRFCSVNGLDYVSAVAQQQYALDYMRRVGLGGALEAPGEYLTGFELLMRGMKGRAR